MKRILFLLCLFFLTAFTYAGNGFTVADVFTDHMVLQRNAEVKIWGEAADGLQVQVRLNGKTGNAKAVKGKWLVTLQTGEAGGPYELEIIGGNDKVCFKDVFIGDVWLAGGQSNMEFALRRVKNAQVEINSADYPLIRYYKVPRKFYPEHNVAKANWSICSPQSAPEFAAIAYYFARNIHKELHIPIGIIQVPVGGTTVEAWSSRGLLMSDADFRPIVQYYDSIANSYKPGEYEQVYERFTNSLAEYNALSAEQKKYIEKPAEPMGKWNFRRPIGLSENMLSTVTPYTLKGFIFYQGESNTARGAQYRKLFPAMIKEWRASWGQGDIPFLFIQLPKFETKTRRWNELREAQYLTSLQVKNTAMAVAFDQGNPKDIHPTVKDTVGWRLSQLALGKVYGKKIVCQGPEFKKMEKQGDGSLLLSFDNVGTGLVAKDGASSLLGFTIAGKDGKFHLAEAVIVNGRQIQVRSNKVKDPVDVRYLWLNSADINFFNREGFPALPFRTDKYRLETEGVCVNPDPIIPKLDLYLFIGQSNMAGRGYITDNYKSSLKNVYLLTPTGSMEPARNPLNKYSTVRKSLKMQGVGPAYSFAKSMTEKTGHPIGLVVNARGGSSINSWLKGAEDDYYGEALARVRQAMKFGMLKGIIWHQGESDSREPQVYMEKLQKLVADLRNDLGNDKLPFIVGEIAEWRANGTSGAFNEMLRTVPAHIPYSACVSSQELIPLINENDPHFSADSQIILGRRYAAAAYKACYTSSTQADNGNIALHKPVTASSQQKEFPASNVTDGIITRTSAWMSGKSARPPHMLDINLQKYYDVDRIVIYTGIPEAERTVGEQGQAPGFWSMKNFKIQYWDDANWTDLPNTECTENRLDKLEFTFSPHLTTFQIRLVSTDGEPIRINEFEVYGKEKNNMPVPVTTGETVKRANISQERDIQITVTKDVMGKSMKYVGYNQGYYMPGSNISGWLEYSNANALRVWTSISDYVPVEAVLNDKELTTLSGFEAYKSELRSNPEGNRFINWQSILHECRKEQYSTNSMVFEYALKELKRLDIDVILQMNTTDFDGTWSNKWKQWQRFYALAFYAAKTGDVTMFAMHNEPNHRHAGPMKITQYVDAMKIVSDAVRCAVQDVNRLYGKHLESRFVSPVTAGSNANWWAEVVKSLRIDYRGLPLDRDLMDIFSTHSYNLPAAGYASKVSDIRNIIVENHPLKQPLPIVYTETGRWMNAYLIDKHESMDSPSLFTEWAGEYTNNTLNGGYGMWAFKFANTTSGTYPRGIKSGHHFIWQGKRIVEDAYRNVALGKPATAKEITDGDKTDASIWVSPDTDKEKYLEINLGKSHSLGGAVVYTGSEYGIYTGPDRVKNFRLQYWNGNDWADIKETIEENARYVQSFFIFNAPVNTSKVRFVATDKGSIKVREIKLFDAESMKNIPISYDVSGIQRTGEVVRLFAKGFKDERPLLNTVKSIADNDVDAITSFSPSEMRYYVWLVQRKPSANDITLDIKSLNLPVGTKVFAEEVSANTYGEVTWVKEVSEAGKLSFELPSQSVMLLTIPIETKSVENTLVAVADAVVKSGNNKDRNFGKAKTMKVEMNASNANHNQVSYIKFDISKVNKPDMNAALLKVYGYSSAKSPYRFHVYALDNSGWNEDTLSWNNAPNLEKEQARITDVGNTAHVAGEVVVNENASYHQLDVTSLIYKCKQPEITFVLIRELRQLGDDGDNNKSCSFETKESVNAPVLSIW